MSGSPDASTKSLLAHSNGGAPRKAMRAQLRAAACVKPADVACRDASQDGGFALIVVIWGIGLLSVIAASFLITVNSQTRAARNMLPSSATAIK